MRRFVSRSVQAAALWMALDLSGAFAQKKEKVPRLLPLPATRPHANMHDGHKGPGGPKGTAAAPRKVNPYNLVDRWNAMNPKQRERLLAKMPPERQKQFLEKVEKFNALPEQEQQIARERYDRLSKLPEEDQQVVLRDIRRLNNLPPARQQAMNQEFLKLRQMSDSERSAYLSSSEFKDKFYPNERQMIGNLAKVLATRKP
jgi:hypothetical protein